MKSKLLLLLLTLLTLTSASVSTVYAKELSESDKPSSPSTVHTEEDTYINPLYKDVLTEEDLLSGHTPASNFYSSSPAEASSEEEPTYLTSIGECAAQMRQAMTERKESIIIYFQAPAYDSSFAKDLANKALIHTGVPVEGDYLKWQYGGWHLETSYYTRNETCYMKFTYTVTYYTTAEQEAQVNSAIDNVLSSLALTEKNDYEKIKSIYDYICTHTTYDYDNLENEDHKLKYTAYGALIDGKAVCQGYAVLFYRLSLELGIDNRLISGYGNKDTHGWNIVRMENSYYNADATWDAGKEEYSYFLKGQDNFKDHTRDEEYTTEEFLNAYPMSSSDYIPAAPVEPEQPSQPEIPSILSVYSRNPETVKVTWTKVDGAVGYQLWRAERENATEDAWVSAKTIREADFEKYTNEDGNLQYVNNNLKVGKTYYYKVRAFKLNSASANIDDETARIYSDFSTVDHMPATVVFENVYSNSAEKVRLSWNKVNGAHGYQIWREDGDGTWKVVKTLGPKNNILGEDGTPDGDSGSITAYSNTGLESGKVYKYKMRAFFIPENGKKVFGAYSEEVQTTVMPAAPILKAQSIQPRQASLSWTSVNNAEGYQIWRSENNGESYIIVKTITDGTTLYTNYQLSSGKTYYYKVRAYTTVQGKKLFGEYSQPVKITIR